MHRPPRPGFQMRGGAPPPHPRNRPFPGTGPRYGPGFGQAPTFQQAPPMSQMGHPDLGRPPFPQSHGPQTWPAHPPQPFQNRPHFQPPSNHGAGFDRYPNNQFEGHPQHPNLGSPPPRGPPVPPFSHPHPSPGPPPGIGMQPDGPGPMTVPHQMMPHRPGPTPSLSQDHIENQSDRRGTSQHPAATSLDRVHHLDNRSQFTQGPAHQQPTSSQPFQNRPHFQPPPPPGGGLDRYPNNQFEGHPQHPNLGPPPPRGPPVSSFHHQISSHALPPGIGMQPDGPGPMNAPQQMMQHGPGPTPSLPEDHILNQAPAKLSDRKKRRKQPADSAPKMHHHDDTPSFSGGPKWSDAVSRLIDVLQEDKATHSNYQFERGDNERWPDSPTRQHSPHRRHGSREKHTRETRSRSPRHERRRGRESERERERSPLRRRDTGSQRSGRRSRSPSRHHSKSSRHRSDVSEQRRSRGSPGRGRSPTHDRHGNRRSPDHRRHRREIKSKSPSGGRRRREQSPQKRESSSSSSSKREDMKKPKRCESHRRSPTPPKPRQRWDELEEALEAERQANELSPEPLEESDADGSDADDLTWIQCSPRENFYSIDPKDQVNSSSVAAAEKLKDLLTRFETEIVERGPRIRASQPQPEQKQAKQHWHVHSHEHSDCSGSDSSDSDTDTESSSEDGDNEEDNERMVCMQNRENHPWRLAENLWFNEPGEMNDGPLCKCSLKQQKSGIRHNIYPGEQPIPPCDPFTNNATRLHHYRITISPTTNFLSSTQTVIVYDKREYIFEGFSIFSHQNLDEVPECKVMRFGREYTLHFFSEPKPENFTVQGLDLFAVFLFEEILELYDFDFKGQEGGCHHFHFMPRFARLLPNNGKEILSMHHVIQYLIRSSKPIIDAGKLDEWLAVSEMTWQKHVDKIRNMIATRPGKKPSSIRIDQLDRDQMDPTKVTFPVIVHFGVRPAQLSYIGDPNYRKLHKSYLRLRHLLFNRPRVTKADRRKLAEKEERLQKMRLQGNRVREVTAEVSSEHMLGTGIGVDICQHAMMLPVLVNHLRYFACLTSLYKVLDYKFTDPVMLKHAMTHPSFKQNYGTNPDHVRNSLYNCGTRQLEYVAHKKQLEKERKKGINQLYKIMSLMATEDEIPSHIKTYERLEFLGDAVIEFLSSTHLYYLFPNLEEGGLATYRVALVQNQHLSVLAKKLELDRYMLYAHGPDLCRPYDLRHAMANCFEAVMGALYLEAGLDHAKKIFGQLLFEEDHLQGIWFSHPKDPLQIDFPDGDRHMIESSAILKKLTSFEETTGIRFKHIRLLARSFTQRTVGYTHLTRGSNQRLEFLGDSVLQLVVSTYLYKHFPDHHEGHLSLLRSSLVNNRTQSIVAADLGMENYIIDTETRKRSNDNIPMKIMADLLEALIGAMYVDHGLVAVETFCGVLFFPRLKDFIETQDWNDAKSQLQQCCLTLRMEGQEPDVPSYKVISQSGPTNSRQYSVAVYFKGKRMATGTASNIQDAQMEAAKNALKKANFPHLWYQRKCVMAKKQGEEDGGSGGDRGRRDVGEGHRRERKGSPHGSREDSRDHMSGRRDRRDRSKDDRVGSKDHSGGSTDRRSESRGPRARSKDHGAERKHPTDGTPGEHKKDWKEDKGSRRGSGKRHKSRSRNHREDGGRMKDSEKPECYRDRGEDKSATRHRERECITDSRDGDQKPDQDQDQDQDRDNAKSNLTKRDKEREDESHGIKDSTSDKR